MAYLPLSTANLPDPVIDPAQGSSPEDYFNTVLYTGNGGTLSVPVGFAPDFTWIKNRSNAYNHRLYDKIRGNSRAIQSNQTNAESTYGAMSFESNGFAFTNDPQQSHNTNGDSYVAWNWKANGSGVSNTDGSITSTVSANTKSGFAVVKYVGNSTAGATVGHGLDSALDMFIVKNRDRSADWHIYHTDLGATKNLKFTTASVATQAGVFNNTEPTSTVFSLGTNSALNASGEDIIAYCFHSVEGFSKFGSYQGSDSADGPFIYTGFKPKLVIVKCTTNADDWCILDGERDSYNVADALIKANGADAELTYTSLDMVSNGFKLRVTNSYRLNKGGASFIYMAFAENPFKYSNAR